MMKLRPKPGTVVYDNPGHCRTVVTRVVETTQKLVVHTLTTYFEFSKYETPPGIPKARAGTINHQKMLCVNGPKYNQWLVPEDATGYTVYNRASGHRGQRGVTEPTCVLVFLKGLI